jgi:hypothetical protein
MVGLAALFGLWLGVWERFELPGSIGWRVRRSREREQDRLRRAPIADLVSEIRASIRYERWEGLGPAGTLLSEDRWTDETLLRALEAFRTAVDQDDAAKGRSGRDSGAFEFYDCGLAAIHEALQKRHADAGP